MAFERFNDNSKTLPSKGGISELEKQIGISDLAAKKRERLISAGKLTLESFKKSMEEVRRAESDVLRMLIPEDETLIEVDSHVFESNLTKKNKASLAPILPQIGTLFIYQCEWSSEKKMIERIEILSPENENTDESILKIHVRRKNWNSPFFIEKIDILGRGEVEKMEMCE